VSTFWVRVLVGLGVSLVAVMLIHAAATMTLLGWVYPLFCVYMIHVWWTLRRTSEEAARGADGLYLGGLFFVARVAEPSFVWFESLF
jgi:hypothetical protein